VEFPTRIEVAGGCPSVPARIVQFRARQGDLVPTANDEHLAVGQQSGGMREARRAEAAGLSPGAGGRIVEFGKQCRGVEVAKGMERTRVGPSRSGRVVEFCSPQGENPEIPAATSTRPLASKVAV
jgi:hypothetical protein